MPKVLEVIKSKYPSRECLKKALLEKGNYALDGEWAFEANHVKSSVWLYTIKRERAQNGDPLGWRPTGLTSYEQPSLKKAVEEICKIY